METEAHQRNMDSAFTLITLLVAFVAHVLCGELTFELPDNERECFFEHIEKGIQCTLEFQVSLKIRSLALTDDQKSGIT